MLFSLIKKEKSIALIFALVLLAAFFLRTYEFHDWLYFKMDQSRDAQLVAKAMENGPGYLPLLGPRAGATEVDSGFLRLGPIFYYFQYISGIIFNSTSPEVFAYPDLFFSMLSIVLLYFFAKMYFPRIISLLISSLYAFSFVIIQYSRFAWNPNSLQFFTLLTFFALLKYLNEKNEKKKMGWVALWSMALAVGSQLHFFGFFALLGISGLLILFHSKFWKKDVLKNNFNRQAAKRLSIHAAIFSAVFLFIYTPVIISDVIRKGENAGNFMQALSSKPSDKPFSEKALKNLKENARYYCLITTSFCNEKIKNKDIFPEIFSTAAIILGLMLAAHRLKNETDSARKDFLALVLIWTAVFFILTTPIAFQLRPRFFILTFSVPFILMGVIFDFLKNKYPIRGIYFVGVMSMVVAGLNFYGTAKWFEEQKDSQEKTTNIDRTLILKTKDGVTLGQLEEAANFIYERKKENARVYFYVKQEHVQPIRYLLAEKKDDSFEYFSLSLNGDPKAQYFAIIPSKNDLSAVRKKFGKEPQVVDFKKSGQITVYEIKFLDLAVDSNFKPKEKKDENSRVYWKDVF